MTDRKRIMRKGFSWLLSAALTVGLLSVTGLTAGAETAVPEQTVSQKKEAAGEDKSAQAQALSEAEGSSGKETGTASDAEKTEETGQDSTTAAEEEPLDEEGLLLDGEVAGIPDSDPEEADTATRSSALRAQKKRQNYPLLFPYFETITSDRLTFRLYARNLIWGEDKVYYSFITREEWDKAYISLDFGKALREILLQEDRVREYDIIFKPSVIIPDYLKEIGLEYVPGNFYFWTENPEYPALRDIYASGNRNLKYLEYEGDLPRVIAEFEDGNEARSGIVEKGTKILLKTEETYYDQIDYEIKYTLNGKYPRNDIVFYTFPESLFAKDEDISTYDPEKPIVINEDTVLRAVAVPVLDGQPIELPDGYNSWIVGTWNFRVGTGKEDLYEPNNSRAEAFRIDFPSQIEATVHSADDHDFYSFTNGNYGSLRLTLTPPPYCAYGLRILNEKGEVLKECVLKPEEAGQMGESQTILYSGADAAGLPKDQDFTVEVWSLNGTFNEELPYTLRLVPTVYASSGKLASDPDFSEMDMVLACQGLYDGDQTDYTGATARDASNGGFLWTQLDYLSQWYGPVDERLEPYPSVAYSDDPDERPKSFKYHDHSASVKYHLQNAVLGLSPEDGDEEYRNSIKNMVYTYGACSLSYDIAPESGNLPFVADDGTAYRKQSFYYDTRPRDDRERHHGHYVTVVGWDDNLPKELFSHSKGEGLQDFGMPEKDGGFLIRNSWGEESGIAGFFWVSYESTSLQQGARMAGHGPTAFLMEKAGQYDRQYLNDATSIRKLRYTESLDRYLTYGSGSVEAGNVFTADDNDQLLTAVSLVVLDPAVNYDIWLTVGGETKKILSGCEQNAGYYTKRLSDPVLLKAGSIFTLTEVLYADEGKELAFPYGTGVVSEGLSFCVNRKSGILEDMSEEGLYPCLRAFTVIPGYEGKPKRICGTSLNENYGQTVSRDKDYVPSEYAAEAIEKNSLENTLESSAAGSTAMVSDLPAAYDARDYGLVTTVKNQGRYGTCWAFSAIAALESNVLLNGGTRMEYARTISTSSPDSEVQLTKDMQTYTVRGSAKLDAENVYGGSVFWTYSGDTDSIEVLCTSSETGEEVDLFRFIKPGKVTVCASSGVDIGLASEMEFTATVREIESIALDRDSYEMKEGEELQLKPQISPEDVWNSTILYSSSDPSVAYVDKNGKITALKGGTATVTLKGGDKVLEVQVKVIGKKRPPKGDSEDPSEDDPDDNSSDSGEESEDSPSETFGNEDRERARMSETAGSWKLTGDGWSFLLADGTAAKGQWILTGGKWYYIGADGIMRTGWLLDQGRWYYLAPGSGEMQTGLITESGYQYYLSPADGHMLTGIIQIPGFAEPMYFIETLPPAPTYTMDPLSGIWKRNNVDALPYGCRM